MVREGVESRKGSEVVGSDFALELDEASSISSQKSPSVLSTMTRGVPAGRDHEIYMQVVMHYQHAVT